MTRATAVRQHASTATLPHPIDVYSIFSHHPRHIAQFAQVYIAISSLFTTSNWQFECLNCAKRSGVSPRCLQ